MIAELYLANSRQTRERETSAYLRTLTGKFPNAAVLLCCLLSALIGEWLTFDHTFKITKKETVAHGDSTRINVMEGGLFVVNNERNLIITFVSYLRKHFDINVLKSV